MTARGWKRALDCLMVLLLPLLMAYSLVGEAAHEWLGTAMFLLFLGHHGLNWRWYPALLKGRWTAARVFQTAVSALLLLAMLGLMASGVMLSRHVFSFLPRRGGQEFARTLHMLSSYWGFCLMGLHLGLHWRMVMGWAGQRATVRPALLSAAGLLAAGYGVYAFFKREVWLYLFLRSHFVFFDFSEPLAMYLLDYIAVLAAFVWLGHYAARLLQRVGRKADHGTEP